MTAENRPERALPFDGANPSDRALYAISVAAELTGIEPQNLRNYEAKGLIEPYRTEGGTRRYSDRDLRRINRIATLIASGLNLAGVAHVLELEEETERLRREINRLRDRVRRPDRSARKDSPR